LRGLLRVEPAPLRGVERGRQDVIAAAGERDLPVALRFLHLLRDRVETDAQQQDGDRNDGDETLHGSSSACGPARMMSRAPLLAIAGVGLVVNLVGAWLLHQGARESLNVRAAYLEVLSDALTSVGVIVAAVAVLTTGATVVDPIVSAAIAIFIVPRTWRLLRQ